MFVRLYKNENQEMKEIKYVINESLISYINFEEKIVFQGTNYYKVQLDETKKIYFEWRKKLQDNNVHSIVYIRQVDAYNLMGVITIASI